MSTASMSDSVPPSSGPITRLLRRLQDGDASAQDELYELLYARLRLLAARHLQHEGQAWTLSPTSLVHEAYLAMVGHEHGWNDHAHALAVASKAMRQILVDYARRRTAQKRGSGAAHVSLEDSQMLAAGQPIHLDGHAASLLDLDRALTSLSEHDGRLGRVIECRVFGGLTSTETAAALRLSTSTVDRDWARARAYLRTALA